VLRRNGYEATTMKDIAAQVNLTAASLYHHFKNKDMLLLAVLEGGLSHVIDLMQPIVRSELSSRDKLAQMIRTHVCSVTQNTAVSAAMVFEIRSLMSLKAPPRNGGQFEAEVHEEVIDRRDTFFARRDEFEALFEGVVRSGVVSGEFRAVDVPIFVKTMLGAHNWVGVWFRAGGRLGGDEIAAQMIDTFLRALEPEKPTHDVHDDPL